MTITVHTLHWYTFFTSVPKHWPAPTLLCHRDRQTLTICRYNRMEHMHMKRAHTLKYSASPSPHADYWFLYLLTAVFFCPMVVKTHKGNCFLTSQIWAETNTFVTLNDLKCSVQKLCETVKGVEPSNCRNYKTCYGGILWWNL